MSAVVGEHAVVHVAPAAVFERDAGRDRIVRAGDVVDAIGVGDRRRVHQRRIAGGDRVAPAREAEHRRLNADFKPAETDPRLIDQAFGDRAVDGVVGDVAQVAVVVVLQLPRGAQIHVADQRAEVGLAHRHEIDLRIDARIGVVGPLREALVVIVEDRHAGERRRSTAAAARPGRCRASRSPLRRTPSRRSPPCRRSRCRRA